MVRDGSRAGSAPGNVAQEARPTAIRSSGEGSPAASTSRNSCARGGRRTYVASLARPLRPTACSRVVSAASIRASWQCSPVARVLR